MAINRRGLLAMLGAGAGASVSANPASATKIASATFLHSVASGDPLQDRIVFWTRVTTPNSLPMIGGKGPKDYITMGGMFTIVKIRKDLTTYDDPGWYQDPPGTAAIAATPDQLRRDGIAL